jgi:plasmid stability protein
MATIQIRDLPEDAYETIRRRARAQGRSIQAYMRDRVVEFAATPTKEESVEAIEAALALHGGLGASAADIADDVAADRR